MLLLSLAAPFEHNRDSRQAGPLTDCFLLCRMKQRMTMQMQRGKPGNGTASSMILLLLMTRKRKMMTRYSLFVSLVLTGTKAGLLQKLPEMRVFQTCFCLLDMPSCLQRQRK